MVNIIILVFLIFIGCNKTNNNIQTTKIKENWTRDALVSAANEDGFYLDEKIQNTLEQQRRNVLGRLYLENIINSRVSVSMGEVEKYYKKTKDQHLRQSREFLFLRFSSSSHDTAKTIKKRLDSATGLRADETLGELIELFKPTRELVDENKIKKSIKSQFLQRRGAPVSVGPMSKGGQHVVFHLIRVYEKGTTKEQIHVQEKLRNQLFAMKAHSLRQNIVDSLKSKYSVLK